MALVAALGMTAAALAVACSGPIGETEPSATIAGVPSQATASFGQYPEFKDEAAGLTVIFGTPDIGVGRRRVAYVITEPDGVVRLPITALSTYFYPDRERGRRLGPVESVTARFHEFPLGTRGSYDATVNIDRAGLWGFEISFPRSGGARAVMEFTVDVPATPKAPDIGEAAPRSKNRTIASVSSINELTTASMPDRALYRATIAETITAGRPAVIVFTSPAFCTTPLCGPQVDVASRLRETYGDRVEFIHVDLYENPHEIQGDLSRARRSGVVEQWALETDEWTFVVDRQGTIAARFESFAPEEVVEEAVRSVLASGPAS
ncbi:MAG: hypothetical protein HY678_09380 [Chloroflexi bacterium]|nr:hypothetical protein [Chloroflexota bacterium]